MVEPLLPADRTPPREPHPLLGYAMVLIAATLWAVNGAVSKVILDSGVSSLRLSEVRSTGAFVGLALALALVAPRRLRISRSELPMLALFGIAGLAFVQWFYFVAIHRMSLAVALLIQYLAPLLVALFSRFVLHVEVRRRIWLALALALVGLSFVLEIWSGAALDGIGVGASLLAATSYALYILVAERELGRRDAISLTTYGFLFASLFWAVVQPWWTFPTGRDRRRSRRCLGPAGLVADGVDDRAGDDRPFLPARRLAQLHPGDQGQHHRHVRADRGYVGRLVLARRGTRSSPTGGRGGRFGCDSCWPRPLVEPHSRRFTLSQKSLPVSHPTSGARFPSCAILLRA